MKHTSSRGTFRNPDNTPTWLMAQLPPHLCKIGSYPDFYSTALWMELCKSPSCLVGDGSPDTATPERVRCDPRCGGMKKYTAL